MRTLWDIFGQTLRTLWAHKLRSFLTMFGIAWGVFSLLLLVGLGEGFRSGNKKQLAQIGENIMFIFGGRVPAAEGSHTASHTFQVTYADYLAIKRDAKQVGEVAPVLNRPDIRVIYDSQSTNGQVFGVTGNYNRIRYMPIDAGRWIHDSDDADHHYVAVLGNEMFKNLFGRNGDAIGKTILLNGYRFTVVGTVRKMRGESSATDMRVFIPFSVMQEHFPLKDAEKPDSITYINFQPRTIGEHVQAQQEVRAIVGKNHGGIDPTVDDYWFDWDTIEQQKTIGKIWDAMNSFLGGVGLITLVLGAIGVINIMLVAVAERTREIGLRKALGATNRSILTQFFIEGAFLTTLSGSIGILLAWGLMAALGTLPAPEGFDPPTLVPTSAMLALFSLSAAGVIAGLYPARKAALLTPVEALRQE